MNSVPNSSFSRRPGSVSCFRRGWVRVCSTIGDGFCGCWAKAAHTARALPMRQRTLTLSGLCYLLPMLEMAALPAVREVNDLSDPQPYQQAQPVGPAKPV